MQCSLTAERRRVRQTEDTTDLQGETRRDSKHKNVEQNADAQQVGEALGAVSEADGPASQCSNTLYSETQAESEECAGQHHWLE